MTTFHCKIGGFNDFGPAGFNALIGVTLTPSGPGKIGSCKLTLQKAGGGYVFANMIEVQVYETDGSGTVVWRWFGGFVTRVTTRRIAGTNLKIYELDCQDYNLLLQTLVCDAKTTLVLSADTFVNQVADLFTQLTTGASKGIDATSGVADILPAVTLPDVHARGKTAAVILDRIFSNVRLEDSTIRPAAFLGLDATNGLAGNFGLPTLQIYDRAAPPSATVTLTDENSTIRQEGGFVRTLDAAKLVTHRQVIVTQTGGVHDAADATAAALYPNPYDPDGYWHDVPVEDTESITDADAIALAQAAVQKVSNPRETIQLTTTERVRPGDFVSVTWTLEGLAAAVYEVVETNVEFEAKNPARPVYHITLGARKRSLGETDDDSISVPPVIYDHVPPDQPATPTYTTTYNRATNTSTVVLSWAANTEDDMDHYLLRLARAGAAAAWIIIAAGASPQYTYSAPPSEAFTASVQAQDTSGNLSPPSATRSGTSAAAAAEVPGPPATVTVTGTRTGPNTGQANLSWTAGTGGTGTAARYEARYYVTASGASTATIIPVATDNRVLIIPGLPVGTQYTFNVRSITAYGDTGGWSTSAPTLTLGAQVPPAPTSLTVLDYDPGQTGQSAWILLGWTAGTGGTGTVATWNVRVDWTEASTGVVRKWHKDGIPAADVSTLLSPLTAGPSYTITLWGVTAWGESSAAASTTYTIAGGALATLYNGGFEVASPANKTLPDGWAISVTSGTAAISLSPTQVLEGAQSVRIVRSGAGAATVTLTSRRFAVLPGQMLYVTGGIYGLYDSGLCAVTPGLRFYQQNGSPTTTTPLMSFFTPPNPGPGWGQTAQLAGTVTPPDAVVGEMLITAIIGTGQTTVYLDGFSVGLGVLTSQLGDAQVTADKAAAGIIDTKAKFGSGMAAIQRGSTTPIGFATDDLLQRTDKDRLGTSDGTRVLSVAPVPLPWLNNASLNPFSVSGVDAWYSILPNDLALYLERWTCVVRGNTTNNASNFWTIALQGFTGGVGTTLDSFTTAAMTVNALTTQHRALTTALTAGQYDFLALIATKTGAPGTLFLMPHLRAREIL